MRPDSVYLFTNRNCLVFDVHGNQIPELQAGISCYELNREIAQQIADTAQHFYISKLHEWAHPIGKKSFEYLLGLRTRERDIAEHNLYSDIESNKESK